MTDKVSLNNLTSLSNSTTAINTINANNAAITTAMDNTLSRDGTSPNQMGAALDMNNNRIINLPAPVSALEPLRLQDYTTLQGGGTITFNALPAGGTKNQILIKNSSTNYDASWFNAPVINVQEYGAVADGGTGTINAGAAIENACNSGAPNSPVVVYIPAGTYSIWPRNLNDGWALVSAINIANSNVILMGAGRGQTILKVFITGGRNPLTNFDVLFDPGDGINAVQRCHGIFINGPFRVGETTRNNIIIRDLTIDGQCPRDNFWPIDNTNGPPPQTPGIPMVGPKAGIGWDTTHHAITLENNAVGVIDNIRIQNCELTNFMGEIVAYGGTPKTNIRIDNCLIHGSNAVCITGTGQSVIADCELYDVQNQALENGPQNTDNTVERCYIHDCGKGLTFPASALSDVSSQGRPIIIRHNIFRNCPLTAVFLTGYMNNTYVYSNYLVDCGTNPDGGGLFAINANFGEGDAGHPQGDIVIDDNIIEADTATVFGAIRVADNNAANATKGKYVTRNRLLLSDRGKNGGKAITNSLVWSIGANGDLTVANNDFKFATNGPAPDTGFGLGGNEKAAVFFNNIHPGDSGFAIQRIVSGGTGGKPSTLYGRQDELNAGGASRIELGLDASDNPRLGFGLGTSTRDVFLMRNAAGVFEVNNGTLGTLQDIKLRTLNGLQIRSGITSQTASSYTVGENDDSLVFNPSTTATITLPAAGSYPGRWIHLKTITAQAVVSTSANVVPLAGGAAGTALVPATAGKFVTLQSDGSNWNVMMGN